MRIGFALIALALLASACDQQGASSGADTTESPQLDAPAPDTQPSRNYATANDAAGAATGQISVAVTTRLPDATQDGGDALEVLTITGANGVVVEANLVGAVSPATQVQGQTLRALLNIPVEEPQVLVYRVTGETKPSGQGVCGADSAGHVVIWEPTSPGEVTMKVLGIVGGAPGAGDSRPCTMLEYRRS